MYIKKNQNYFDKFAKIFECFLSIKIERFYLSSTFEIILSFIDIQKVILLEKFSTPEEEQEIINVEAKLSMFKV